MKRVLIMIAVIIALVFGHFLAAPGTVFAQSSKPITLKASFWYPPVSWMGKQYQGWIDEVAKRTNGRVKIEPYWMDSLVKQKDMLPGLKAGMTDIGFLSAPYFPSNFPLSMMLDNFGNCSEDYVATTLAMLDTIENQPDLRAEREREGVILVAPYISGIGGFAFAKRLPSFMDIKGKSIRTFGGTGTYLLKNLGATPIFMPYTDIYEALDRGTVDGFQIVTLPSDAMKHYEVIKCLYMVKMGAAISPGAFMSRKVFQGLPPDIQKIFLDLRKDFGIGYSKALMNVEANIYHKWVFKYDVGLITLIPDEWAFFNKAVDEANATMIQEQEKKGAKASGKVWNFYREALKKRVAEAEK